MRRTGLVALAVAAAALAGCAPGPEQVPGPPAALTAAPGTAGPAGAPGSTPSRPPAVASPSGPAVLPGSYLPYTLSGFGVTVRLPVPAASWSMTPTEDDADAGHDFGDPSGRVLLRVAIRRLEGTGAQVSAARAWELGERENSRSLGGYRRLDIVEVPGLGDSAADWTFTFERGGVRRQVLDRGISVGGTSVALYFSADQAVYDAMLPVFTAAAAGLTITRA